MFFYNDIHHFKIILRVRDANSPAFKSGQSWGLKIFPLVPPLIFRLMIKNFRKLSFDTPFQKFSPAQNPKRVGIPTQGFQNYENLNYTKFIVIICIETFKFHCQLQTSFKLIFRKLILFSQAAYFFNVDALFKENNKLKVCVMFEKRNFNNNYSISIYQSLPQFLSKRAK